MRRTDCFQRRDRVLMERRTDATVKRLLDLQREPAGVAGTVIVIGNPHVKSRALGFHHYSQGSPSEDHSANNQETPARTPLHPPRFRTEPPDGRKTATLPT